MSTWFRDTEESRRLLSEERLLVAATEKVYEALERRGSTKTALAESLGVKLSEVSQRLSGRRNLTLRSLAAMLHSLGYEAEVGIRDCRGIDATPVYSSARTMDWPQQASYRQQRASHLRVITGEKAAA